MKEIKPVLKKIKGLFIKEVKDDRIKEETNKLYSKGLLPILILSVISIILKLLVFDKSIWAIDLEIVGIMGAIIIVIGYALYYKIPLLNSKDENILKIQYSHRTKAFFFVFFLYIIGDFIKISVLPDYDLETMGTRFLIWFLVVMPLTGLSVKKGLMTQGVGKKKEKAQKQLKYSYMIASPLFGIFMAREDLFTSDADIIKGLLTALGYGLIWGIFSYFLMKKYYKNSEKNADKLLEDIDEE